MIPKYSLVLLTNELFWFLRILFYFILVLIHLFILLKISQMSFSLDSWKYNTIKIGMSHQTHGYVFFFFELLNNLN